METGQKNATVKVILFKSKKLSNGDHPLMLRVYKDGQRKYFATGLSCPLEYWDLPKERPKTKHPNKNEIISRIQTIEKEFLDKINDFKFVGKNYTVDNLIETVVKKNTSNSVYAFIDDLVKTTKAEKRMKTADTYKECKQMMLKFNPNQKLIFNDIDYIFLSKWESFMRQNDFKETSMSVYFRTLRSIYNKAIKEEIAQKTAYPFETYKISKFNTKTRKRAIPKSEIIRIFNYPTQEGSKLRECINIFKFSYLNQGMNFVDLANLTWKDINSQSILEYTRRKTGRDFAIIQSETSLQILEEYKPLTGYDMNNYIFPILDKKRHKTAGQIQNRLKKILTEVNANLKIISKNLGIDANITTYVARHTYATVLRKSGVSDSIISEALGHESEAITKVYLEDFEAPAIFEANKFLL